MITVYNSYEYVKKQLSVKKEMKELKELEKDFEDFNSIIDGHLFLIVALQFGFNTRVYYYLMNFFYLTLKKK